MTRISKFPILGLLLLLFPVVDTFHGFLIYNAFSAWQMYVWLVVKLIGFGLVLGWNVALLRGNQRWAIGLILSDLIVRGISNSFFIEGVGVLMQFFVLFTSGIIVIEWMNRQQSRQWMPGVILASLLMLLFDLLPLSWQQQNLPFLRLYIFIVIGVMIALVGYAGLRYPAYPMRTKLILLLLSLSTAFILGLAVATNYVAQRTVFDEARVALTSSADNLADSLDRFITFNLQSIQSLAATPELITFLETPQEALLNSAEHASITNLLYSYLLRDPSSIISYSLYDRDGICVADTNAANIGVNFAYRSHFLVPYYEGISYATPIYRSTMLDKPKLYFSAPVKNDKNQVVGVLSVQYKPTLIQTLVAASNGLGGDLSYGVLLDENNMILGHGTEPQWVGSQLSSSATASGSDLILDPRLGEALQTSMGTIFTQSLSISAQPVEAAVAATYTYQQPWKILFFQPQTVFLAPIQTQTNAVVLIVEIVAIVVIVIGSIGADFFSKPILTLTRVAQELANGNLDAKIETTSQDEIGRLSETFKQMSIQLKESLEILEKRVQDRTRIIETASQVGRSIATILDPELLVKEVVNQLQEAFNYYHVHIYLYDPEENNLALASSSGEMGDILLKQEYKVNVGQGLVGLAASNLQSILSTNTAQDPRWVPTPLLSETASEIATPILLGDTLVGVLDVQQDQPNSLSKQDVDMLELIAGQIAAALRNASHYQHTQTVAETQSLMNQALEKIRSTTTIEDALRVAMQELARFTKSNQILTFLKVSADGTDGIHAAPERG